MAERHKLRTTGARGPGRRLGEPGLSQDSRVVNTGHNSARATRPAKVVAALFVAAGAAAVFGTPGLIVAIVMSVVQAIWILTAAVSLLLSSRRTAA